MGLLDRLSTRGTDAAAPRSGIVAPNVFRTKALKKFVSALTHRDAPHLLDLGPVVGANVNFFGEQLGCKILVEGLYAELDRHVREDKLDGLPAFLGQRFQQSDGSVDGILCWDLFDYLPRPAAQALAAQVIRILRPDGVLFACFGTAQPAESPRYTKYVVVDDSHFMYQPYTAARARQSSLLNRDILRLFTGLEVVDSFLLQNNVREIVFRKTP